MSENDRPAADEQEKYEFDVKTWGKAFADELQRRLKVLDPATERPVSDPSETLALIAEHRLTPLWTGSEWMVVQVTEMYYPREGDIRLRFDHHAGGATIGDAVRACVQRIREQAPVIMCACLGCPHERNCRCLCTICQRGEC